MNNCQYNSHFSEHIRNLLELRAAMGRHVKTLAYQLQSFDRFCIKHYPEEKSLIRELATDWCSECESGSGSGYSYRMYTMRTLGKYIVSLGQTAFVFPSEWIAKPKAGLPYIFSDEELKLFFAAADTIKPSFYRASHMREYTIPVIFRLMLGCGLRPQEARRLKRNEVNIHDGKLCINASKGNMDRVLPISADLINICRNYDRIFDIVYPDREYFFQCPKGKPYRATWITAQFHRCRELAGGIAPNSTPYDFRHNFATRTLMRWAEEGKDFGVWLPYLSTYMGHVVYSSTACYVHLLPERLSRCDFTKINGIIPEVSHEQA